MKNNFLLDTSFLSGLINSKDRHNQDATSIYIDFGSRSNVLIPAIVKLELVLLTLKFKNFEIPQIDELLQKLGVEILSIDEPFLKGFQVFVMETRFNLKPNDYLILYSSVKTNSKLVTFDKKLEKYYDKLEY